MSSECFRVRVISIKGKTAVSEWLSMPGGGDLDAVAATRSAALILLNEASADTGRPSPLYDILKKEPRGWLTDSAWHEKNLGRFIECTKLTARWNADASVLDEVWGEAEEAQESAGEEALLRIAWKKAHRYRLEIVVTDAKWLSHLRAGDEVGTTAFDVWAKDDAVTISAKPAKPAKAKELEGGWTEKSRAQVNGSKVPHPLDPPLPSLQKDWKTICAALASTTFGGKGAKAAARALQAGKAPPEKLDAEVERYRLLATTGTKHDALLRTWWRIGGPRFVLDVFDGTSEKVDIKTSIRGGGTSISPDIAFTTARVFDGTPASYRLLFSTIRRLAFSLPEPAWKEFRKAATPHLKRKKWGLNRAVYILGRDPAVAAGVVKGTLSEENLRGGDLLASIHDPAIALAHAKALSPGFSLGACAFDVVEMLGAAAVPVLEQCLMVTGATDKETREAIAIARSL